MSDDECCQLPLSAIMPASHTYGLMPIGWNVGNGLPMTHEKCKQSSSTTS